MLSWLWNTIYKGPWNVLAAIKDFVYGIVHSVIAYFSDVLTSNKAQWQRIWQASAAMADSAEILGNQMYRHFWSLHLDEIPALRAQALAWVQWTQRLIVRDVAMVESDISAAARKAHDDLHAFSVWLFAFTIAPILAGIALLGVQMTEWAFYAFKLLTDLPKLAGMLFWHIVQVAMSDPFTVGKIVGDFLAKLVLQYTLRSIHLVEQIISDVL